MLNIFLININRIMDEIIKRLSKPVSTPVLKPLTTEIVISDLASETHPNKVTLLLMSKISYETMLQNPGTIEVDPKTIEVNVCTANNITMDCSIGSAIDTKVVDCRKTYTELHMD